MSVYSPMARSLPDLVYFFRSVIEMKPWTYDQACSPIPWRMKDVEREYRTGHRRWAVMPTDGVVNPSLACQRAIKITVEALRKSGDEVIEFSPEQLPSHPKDILYLASQLLNSDGTKTYESHFTSFFENTDPGTAQLSKIYKTPQWAKWIYTNWVRHVRHDHIWADLINGLSEKTTSQQWALVAQREFHRTVWFEWFKKQVCGMYIHIHESIIVLTKLNQGIDFLICPPFALPALPHGAMKTAIAACGYTFMFNLVHNTLSLPCVTILSNCYTQLDLPCSVLPITSVDPDLDTPSPTNPWTPSDNRVAQGIYKYYDPKAMTGLPVGVQIVGTHRLEEERVLWATGRVEESLGRGSWETWGCGESGSFKNSPIGGKGWEGGIEVLPDN